MSSSSRSLRRCVALLVSHRIFGLTSSPTFNTSVSLLHQWRRRKANRASWPFNQWFRVLVIYSSFAFCWQPFSIQFCFYIGICIRSLTRWLYGYLLYIEYLFVCQLSDVSKWHQLPPPKHECTKVLADWRPRPGPGFPIKLPGTTHSLQCAGKK